MEKKFLFTVFLPIIVIVAYTLIFHINPANVFLKMNPYFVGLFFLSYFLQIGLLAYRDSKISGLPISITYRSRLFANGVSLVMPGALGPDLGRAIFYVKGKKMGLDKAFSISLYESFYDVTVLSVLFLILIWFHFSPVELILVLTALANIVLWIGGIGYVYGTSHKSLNKIENLIFSIKYIKPLQNAYLNGKEAIKSRMSDPVLTTFSVFLTALAYIIQSIPFYLLFNSFFFSITVNITYQVALLVPIPSAAGVAELALTALVPPLLVLQIRILELVSFAFGLIYVKDIKLSELKDEVKAVWKTT